jgi:hypothetical protein
MELQRHWDLYGARHSSAQSRPLVRYKPITRRCPEVSLCNTIAYNFLMPASPLIIRTPLHEFSDLDMVTVSLLFAQA